MWQGWRWIVAQVVFGLVMLGVACWLSVALRPDAAAASAPAALSSEVGSMSEWMVSDAGDATYDGLYTEDGTYNGKPAYTNGTNWLWWYDTGSAWGLSPSKGSVDLYYAGTGADLPAEPWSVTGVGTAPAPTVTAAEPDNSGATIRILSPTDDEEVSGYGQIVVEYANVAYGAITVSLQRSDGYVEQIGTGGGAGSGHFVMPVNWGLYAEGEYTLWAGAFFLVGGWDSVPITIVAGGVSTPPSVLITAPDHGDTVEGAVNVSIQATDDVSVTGISLYVDDVLVETWTTSGPSVVRGHDLDTVALDDGQRVLKAVAVDEDAGEGIAVIVVTVDNSATVGTDETPPSVTITAPEDAAEVGGSFNVDATITDNVGVTSAKCFVDGALVSELEAANNGENGFRWLLDAREWANGIRTITVSAWDADGNEGGDSITVEVANSLANNTVYLYTQQMTNAAFETWNEAGGNLDLGIETLDIDEASLPTNPALLYNLEIGVSVPGTDADWDEMMLVDHRRSHGFPAAGTTCRWGIKASPMQVLASWTSGKLDLLRLREDGAGGLYILAEDAVLQFAANAITEFRDLSGYTGTPNDLAVWGGKIIVACGAELLVLDPDDGEEDYVLAPPLDCTAFDVVEAQGGSLYIGAGVDATDGRLLSLSASWDLVSRAEMARISALCDCGATLGIGCVDGTIHSYLSGSVSELLATAQDQVERIALVGGMVFAGTGDAAVMYHSLPTWAEEVTLGTGTQVRAIGRALDTVFAGGDDAMLWYRIGTEQWGQNGELDATAINDMASVDGALYIATSHGTDASLYRLELSAETGLVCDTNRPDFAFKVLRRVAV